MNKTVTHAVLGVVALVIIILNVLPMRTRTSVTCNTLDRKIEYVDGQTQRGMPLSFYVSSDNPSESCVTTGVDVLMNNDHKKSDGFYFQALIVDLAVFGAVLTGLNYLLNPKTKPEQK